MAERRDEQTSREARESGVSESTAVFSPERLSSQAASYGTIGDRHHASHTDLRRRSSAAERVNSLAEIGGVNSIRNFARSWQRAAVFQQVTPGRRSFVLESDLDDPQTAGRSSNDGRLLRPRPSFFDSPSSGSHGRASDVLVDADDDESLIEGGITIPRSSLGQGRSSVRRDSIFQIEPQLSSPFGGSYRSRYGSLASRVNESSMLHAGKLFRQQQGIPPEDDESDNDETQPLVVRRVEEVEGKHIDIVVGQSTLPQTIFNSVNTLIGVGMLSLPLAIRYSGWILGLGFFIWSAVVTSYTAKLLAKCLDVDGSLITFADLAYVSFGSRARIATSILFSLELLAACVALVILFADSLNALIPTWDLVYFKIICGILITPLGFIPLRFLSLSSVLGILCCLGIVAAVFVDGLIKPHALGSLREPATTYVFPADWRTLPLAFGLLMAPWGGHSVFPNIYRDMRHPKKYNRAVNVTYVFTFFLEAALAVAGYLMYGDTVRDEITANIFLTEGYPRWISIAIVVAIAIIPLTKLPLNARPIVSTIELFCGLHRRALSGASSMDGMSGLNRGLLKIAIRVLTNVVIIIIAILVPSFDRVMSLLGSLACFTICIILPCAFHLKIFGKELALRQRVLDWTLLVTCTILAILGTAASFVPKNLLGVPDS
ncbi:hypothetical protein FH972_023695 [Carpinus fangiana]|uniref:Amino acid transporter transmembrane domain-containing protein n=1 Tax=Carpinus fangiana TaxID=176857 RepID=A0A5N6KWF6_9ROSI|nr:hypothetical protein FH972_023695 [Carpinus fangiana]